MKTVAIILTYNEEMHVERCIRSVINLFSKVMVIDSYSTDRTVEIASQFNVEIIQNHFINQSQQFNWALSKIDLDTDWIFRIDADEYIDLKLQGEISELLPSISKNINGIVLNRRIYFQNKIIRYGGLFPVQVLRLFRFGKACCESRWMDEHILVEGDCIKFKGELIDNNLNSLTWWINKHNTYASREAIEMLNLEYDFLPKDKQSHLKINNNAKFKRFLKNYLYHNLPIEFRAIFYFIYRYFLRFGFLDGQIGFKFHFLQGFWYRYLVDAKITEVQKYKEKNNVDIKNSITKVLGINL